MLQTHLKWLQDFRMFNLIYPMSNINILDHHFYFKTQRGRIKSQPINSEVSHYHLRLLLGNKEAPWWWPLKAPYSVFASLGHKIKAWVRGVGFLMLPLEWWSSSQGLTGWVGWSPGHGAGCTGVPPGHVVSSWSVTPWGARGTEGWLPNEPSTQFLAILGSNSHMERVLIHLMSTTCLRVSPWSETKLGVWERKASLTSSKKAGGPLGKPVLDWQDSNPNQLSPEKQSALHREVQQM